MEQKPIPGHAIERMNETLMMGIRKYLKASVETDRFYYAGFVVGSLMMFTDVTSNWLYCDFNFRDAFRGA